MSFRFSLVQKRSLQGWELSTGHIRFDEISMYQTSNFNMMTV